MRTAPAARRPAPRCTPLALALALALSTGASAAPFSVTTTASGSVPGSLEQAVNDLNATCSGSGDTIVFTGPAFTGPGPFTIAPSAQLLIGCDNVTINPTGVDVTIDGSSSLAICGIRGASNTTPTVIQSLEVENYTFGGFAAGICGKVRVLGSKIHGNGIGVDLANTFGASSVGDGTATNRNYIYGNTHYGIEISYGGAVSILGNYIGTKDGTTAASNGDGISGNNTSGAIISGNLISGNTYGIALYNGESGSHISGNLIGTDAAGKGALPNVIGVGLSGASGTLLDGGNIISGNSTHGIQIGSGSAIAVRNNKIGLDAAGSAPLGNGQGGITAYCGDGLVVDGNFISANGQGIDFSGVQNGIVTNNGIGVAATGSSPLGNINHGIAINFGDCSQTANANTIAFNTIANNGTDGVLIAAGIGNKVSENRIYANLEKNISINNNATPLPNDPLDADAGPNNQQNYPLVSAVTQLAGKTIVDFQLDSTPNSAFIIEAFSNSTSSLPAAGEAYETNGVGTLSTDAAGTLVGRYTINSLKDNITLTATNTATRDTSEFSPSKTAVQGPSSSISPSTLNLGNVPVGSTGIASNIDIASNGGQPYQITSLAFAATPSCSAAPLCAGGGDFTCTTTCSTATAYTTVPATGCRITTSFAPNIAGPQSATLYLCDNSGFGPRPISLSATGVSLTASPASVDFGPVNVGATSAPTAVTIANPGDVAATLGTFTVVGNFSVQSTTCGTTLPAFSSCVANVVFAPKTAGALAGSIANSGANAALAGTGVTFAEYATPATLDFGSYLLGSSPSPSRILSIVNTGVVDSLVIGTIGLSGPFTVANGCTAPLPPAASCALTLTFLATTQGSFAGSLTIASNARSGTHTVALTARADPVIVPLSTIVPSTLDLGAVPIGQGSAPGTVTITSTGTTFYSITSLVSSPTPSCTGTPICSGTEFSCTTTCSTTFAYAPGDSCQVTATFSPRASASASTTLYLCDNTGLGPRPITLTGIGALPVLRILPASFDFGPVLVGKRGPPQTFAIANPGSADLPVQAVVSGDYVVASSTCDAPILPRSSCFLDIAFAPTAAGTRTGTITVTDLRALAALASAGKATVSPAITATLVGVGTQSAALAFPTNIDFGAYTLGSTPLASRTLELRNTGNAVLTLSSVAVNGPFSLDNPCPPNLAPGQACTLTLTFHPTVAGNIAGSLAIVSNAPGGSGTIALSARAQLVPRPIVHVSPASVGFSDRVVGTASDSQRVTVTNDGGVAATLGPLAVSVDFIVTSTTCGPSLAPASSCFAEVAMRPLGFGARSGQLLVSSDAEGSPLSVGLLGRGCRPFTLSGSRIGARTNCSP
jgi:hypothetical protein